MLNETERSKGEMIKELEKIEADYDSFLEVNNKIFDRISASKDIVQNYKQKEEHFSSFIKNLENLKKEIEDQNLTKEISY